MSERVYFDCHASIGPKPKKHAEERWSLAHLQSDLELAGIAGALVYNRQSQHYDPMLGNLSLSEALAPWRGTLEPSWLLLPPSANDFPSVPEQMRALARHDVPAVRLDPVACGLPTTEWVWGPLRDALQASGLLVVLPLESLVGQPDRLCQWLELWRDCPTLVLNVRWLYWRLMAQIMTRFPRLHMEFSAFQANRGVETFTAQFGAERCLFGTGLLDRAPGCGRGMLDWTLTDEATAAKVAGGNLRRLLGGRGPTVAPAPGPYHDALTAATRAGLPLPADVRDAHCHMLHDEGSSAGANLVFPQGDAKGMIELTRRCGIRQTAIMSWAGPLSMDTDLGNAIVANAVRQYPEEFLGLLTLNPEYQTPAEMQALIEEYHLRRGWPGLKTYTPCQTINYDDPAFAPWFRFASEHRLYAVIDPGGVMQDGPIAFLAKEYPGMSIHLDHCGQSWAYAKWAAKLMQQHPSIYAQMNYTEATNGTVEYLVAAVGAERVLFGTDAPMRDPRPQVSWLVFTRLSEREKRLIFGENFARDLARVRLPGWPAKSGT